MRSRNLWESFLYAADGLAHVLNKDWHARVLFLIASVLLLVSTIARVTRTELLLLCVGITLVVMAEIINSAIEAVVDLVSPGYHELAKAAKDAGGAGVLVAIITGLLICAGVFLRADWVDALRGVSERQAPHVLHVALAGVVTVVVAVVLGKLWGGGGKLTRGGIVSAHSALAFFCFASVCYLSHDAIVWTLTFLLALLVAQSRVEAGIHRVREVVIGGVVALVVSGLLYGLVVVRGGG